MGQYIKVMTLRLFIRIAEKNRAITDAGGHVEKDTILVIFDRLLSIIATQGDQMIKTGMTDELLESLNKEIMENVLNIPLDAKDALAGMPLPIQEMMHEEIA